MSRSGWLAVLALAGGLLVGGCGGDSVEQAGNPLAADTTFVPNTDTVAGRLTEEQVRTIVDNCRDNAGIPGSNGDCTDALPLKLAPCRPTDRWCLTGKLTDVDGVISIVDQGGEKPTCVPRLCGRIKVPGELVEQLVEGQTVSVSPTPSPSPSPTPSPTPTESPTSTDTAAPASPTDSPTP